MTKWMKYSLATLVVIFISCVGYYLFFWPYSVEKNKEALISKTATGRTLGKVKFDIHHGTMSAKKLRDKPDTRFYEFAKSMEKIMKA